MIVLQFGLAMKPWCPSSASALISGITSGTRSSIRKSSPLSITMTPRSTASQPYCCEAPLAPSVPAKKAKSSPSNASGRGRTTWKRLAGDLLVALRPRQDTDLLSRKLALAQNLHHLGADRADARQCRLCIVCSSLISMSTCGLAGRPLNRLRF